MWKYLVLLFLTHYVFLASSSDLPPPCQTYYGELGNIYYEGNYNADAIDEQGKIVVEPYPVLSPCGPGIVCPEKNDDSNESEEDSDETDALNCNDEIIPELRGDICRYNNGPFGSCSRIPLRSGQCSGAYDRALRSIFDYSVKLGFSVLPELAPNRPYYLSSIIPPWYVMAALSLFSYGETRQELLQRLNLRNTNEVICVIQVLNERMSTLVNTENFTAVKNGTFIFANDIYPLTPNFVNTLERILAIPTKNINFNDFVEALNDMNSFVRRNTEGQDVTVGQVFYNEGPIRLVHLAPLYFKSSLIDGCRLPRYRDNFYTGTNCIIPDIPYFRKLLCAKTQYSEYFKSVILEADLEEGFKLFTIKPDRNVDIYEVAARLNYDSFLTERSKLKCKLTDLSLPSLTVAETKFNSRRAMQNTVGNIRLYDYNRAQLTGVSYNNPQLSISHGLQKIRWNQLAAGKQCPGIIPEPEAVVKDNNNLLVLIMRDNLVYMVQLIQNITVDPYEYLGMDIIGF